ncbi:hypothetical protein GLOTRDRAFT_132526 [Gloeophyllum trabeum ATCC 11539]|uniref:Uncharacterized protein n=1 Tax=Gloeophyllum trabeum (strain ATCC 11539 / FP-39264 / Madison 617) TaxID=670483 RepID=S7PVQ1_GLOTA|nr:uncharacterized protein GLOTRDRAFT_132526 [Gloeophyllum trabeum ATCC 11539]EPQ51706.1 hypothetical protein GLOTRDRAFT_132526 [Gloeophyllum trabeum ATCC 11539]
MVSKHYLDQREAWLIAGTLDVFCVQWIDRESAQAYDHMAYREKEDRTEELWDEWRRQDVIDRESRAALRGAARDKPRHDRLPLSTFDTLAPPFSDQDISDYLSHQPAEKRRLMSFQDSLPVLSIEDLKKTDLKKWSKPMRLGSPVANQYLSYIRDDIKVQADKIIRNWGPAPQ